MIKRKQRDKVVISLNDKKIKYLTLSKNDYGFYIKNYDSADLDDGVIVRGEVLKAEFLSKILKKISKKINVKSIDLILPHEYFLFDLHIVKKEKKKSNKKILKKYLNKNKYNISWASTHSYEYDLFDREDNVKALFRAIPNAVNSSYQHVFKKSGMKINSIQSEIVSFSDLLYRNENSNQIFVDSDHTYLLEYKDGVFVSDERFDVSYDQFINDIKKNIKVSDNEAKKILAKYGTLRTHKDEKVLNGIERSMGPILSFLKKDRLKKKNPIYVHFSNTPILGFSDKMRKVLKMDIYDLCVFCSSKNTFQDVLTLHKKDSYEYEPLITRALSVFTKK